MSDYLKTPGKFDAAINRRGIHHVRSARLKDLVNDIDLYVLFKDPSHLADVVHSFDEWRVRDPKEFADRTKDVLESFVGELRVACEKKGVPFGHEDAAESKSGEFSTPPAVVKNVHAGLPYWGPSPSEIWPQLPDQKATLRDRGAQGLSAAAAGISVAQTATGQAGLTGLLVTGGAVTSATGVGLLAGGILLSLIQSGFALKSAVSTHEHMTHLSRLFYLRNEGFLKDTCDGISAHQRQVHDLVANHVLPYILSQKSLKEQRKLAIGALPILGGMAVSGVTATKNIASRLQGTLGVNRNKAAHWLAAHFCARRCLFTDLIVAFLYGAEDMKRLHHWYSYEETAELLALKMKSI